MTEHELIGSLFTTANALGDLLESKDETIKRLNSIIIKLEEFVIFLSITSNNAELLSSADQAKLEELKREIALFTNR